MTRKLARLAGSLLLSGLGAAQAAVTVLGWPGGPEEAALRAAVKVYNERSDVAANDKVALIFFSRDGFYDKLQADLAAGTKAFDANLIATYSIGRYAPFMKPVDLGVSATDLFGKSVLSTMQYQGKQFGVPTDLSLHFMYFRSDLIDGLLKDKAAHGEYAAIAQKYLGQSLTPKDPNEWTWDDYAATALYFTKAINPKSPTRYGTVLQLKNLLFNMMVFHSLPRAYGADWMDPSGNISVNSEAYKKGLQIYKTLLDAGTTPKDSLSYEYAEANAAFASGEVATMMQWNAAAADLKDPKKSPKVASKTAFTAPPSGPQGRFTHVHGLGLGINARGTNTEGAAKFLRWLATPEAMTTYALAGGAPGLSESAVKAVADKRPDLVPLGTYAARHGFMMNGATSAKALGVYELQAKEFTGYWSGKQSLEKTLEKTAAGMAKLLKP
ncbi:extracellular solute-binding protein [Verminephrobacter aporrectodeae subsp. tuberculatae]|nr:extracellular solute-binding protein [Verminephrobacter aporrectodeae subsp. tuberculatae]